MDDWTKSVFLAHASEDKPFVRKLYKRLKEGGMNPWLDEENLMPGVKWDDIIMNAIDRCRFFIACISSHSVTKDGYIQKELRTALSKLEMKSSSAIYFIPALIEDVPLPRLSVGTIRLADYQAVKLFEANGIDKLLDYLQRQANIVNEVRKTESQKYDEVRNEVAKGNVESSLRLLLNLARNVEEDYYNNILIISSRFSRLKQQNILGLITQEEYSMQSNQIVYSILETLKLMEQNK